MFKNLKMLAVAPVTRPIGSTVTPEYQTVFGLTFKNVPGAEQLFTPEFVAAFTQFNSRFAQRVLDARVAREALKQKTLTAVAQRGVSAIAEVMSEHFRTWNESVPADYKIPKLPAELCQPGIHISGPVGQEMGRTAINAVNPPADDKKGIQLGKRAIGYLDDNEDSAGHTLQDMVNSALVRLAIAKRELTVNKKGKEFSIKPENDENGKLPYFMHREPGLQLDAYDMTLNGQKVSGTLLGTFLTFYYAGRAQHQRGEGIYFYLPKTEGPDEMLLYRDMFDAVKEIIPGLSNVVIKAVPLIESTPNVFCLKALIYALGDYAAGLNAARWDLQASFLEYSMADANAIWADRFEVGIWDGDWITDVMDAIVAACDETNAVAFGGMDVELPSNDENINAASRVAIITKKTTEALHGYTNAWAAHIYFVPVSQAVFQIAGQLRSGATPPYEEYAKVLTLAEFSDVLARLQPLRNYQPKKLADYPVRIEFGRGKGNITVANGTGRNALMILRYLEGWMQGRGAVGINGLEDKPGDRSPKLMEDLATFRMSVAQLAQRVRFNVIPSDAQDFHHYAMLRNLFQEKKAYMIEKYRPDYEAGKISQADWDAGVKRMNACVEIALIWILNYAFRFDYTVLGSYSRAQLTMLAQNGADQLHRKLRLIK